MKEPINFDKVADIYDFNDFDYDIPFFLKETEGYNGEILELMCGTGRISIPLLDSGRKMTCVDYSIGMLDSFERKIKDKNFIVDIVKMDVTNLNLKKKFGLILLPSHSISEILSTELQYKALKSIWLHLDRKGVFILTLHNPKVRLKSTDGVIRVIGVFPMNQGGKMIFSAMNQYNQTDKIVSGFQFYEIYDSSNVMIEKRFLEINFKLISDSELRSMIKDLGLEIIDKYGDYSYGRFDEETSNYMIYKMIKK